MSTGGFIPAIYLHPCGTLTIINKLSYLHIIYIYIYDWFIAELIYRVIYFSFSISIAKFVL